MCTKVATLEIPNVVCIYRRRKTLFVSAERLVAARNGKANPDGRQDKRVREKKQFNCGRNSAPENGYPLSGITLQRETFITR